MQWIQGEAKHRTPMLYIKALCICHFHSWEKYEVARNKIRTSWKWFSNVKNMIFYFKNNECNESKGIQKIGPQCCFLRTSNICHSHSWTKEQKQMLSWISHEGTIYNLNLLFSIVLYLFSMSLGNFMGSSLKCTEGCIFLDSIW